MLLLRHEMLATSVNYQLAAQSLCTIAHRAGNSDGNDIDGVHSLSLMAPLGTYTGWNTRAAGFGQGDACDLTGSFIPFPKTVAAASASGDPRQPIASRYPTAAAYDAAVQAAANTLASQGFLLQSDMANAVSQVQTQAHDSGLLPP